MDGILAIWKPEGWTSHDVVAKTRRLLGMKRIGHAGTLDPMVTGVLPLCLGRSTRVVEYIQERPKAYEATITLGLATDTEDMTGEIIERADSVQVTKQQVEAVLSQFIGSIDQVPPMYSAVKVDGKRLYELAREGKSVERKSRTVTIHHIELLSLDLEQQYPQFTFSVLCSKGTYIRTLCVDIGKALGVPAAMAKLVRTMSGGITKESCVTLEQVEDHMREGTISEVLVAPEQAIDHIPSATVKAIKRKYAIQGQRLYWTDLSGHQELEDHALVRVFDEEGIFLGIFQLDKNQHAVLPIKVFS
ncbi:tRNA pseudouridine(55) synthase TruB [Paenibacillus septentrionalis]|uniref:tRNA pseudouridine synthase B n=1 Tax=Paenibacillus septentrionalis TaxID=429342 RepID=A0ABW1V064_9BACL